MDGVAAYLPSLFTFEPRKATGLGIGGLAEQSSGKFKVEM